MTYQPTGQAVNPDDSSVDPRLAAAVPEAQDGREARCPRCGNRAMWLLRCDRHGVLTESESASPAVREGERERLAAIAALHIEDTGTNWCVEDGFDWPCATARILAAPSLAAPEGTGEKP